jgi:replicative DNA helicase
MTNRARLGITLLDDFLEGGVLRGTQTLFIAKTGGGKSMALVHGACSFALQGLAVCYATLELPEPVVLARMQANLTAVPITEILECRPGMDLAAQRLQILQERGLGFVQVKSFQARATSPEHLFEWVELVESRIQCRIAALVVDYLDKLIVPKSERQDLSRYEEFEPITENLRLWAEGGNRWNLTASQSKRSVDRKRQKLGTDDVGDSMHKTRVPDYVLTINGSETIDWFIAKNRHGVSDKTIGPTLPAYEIGRISPRNDRW